MKIKSNVNHNEPLLQKLIVKFKAGDRQAFADLWQKVYPYVYRKMRRKTDSATADDLTSQACTSLYAGGLLKYQPAQGVSFLAWLNRLVENIRIDYLRRERPVNFSELGPGELDNCQELPGRVINPCGTSPLDISIANEEADIRAGAMKLLPGFMDRLSPREQFVVYSAIYDGYSDKKISSILDGDEKYANRYAQMRRRALKKLGKMFAQHGIRKIPFKNV